MTYFDRLASVMKHSNESAQAKKLCAQLRFSSYLSKAQGGRFDKLLDEVLVFLDRAIAEKGVITKEDAKKAEETLLPLSPEAKKYRVHLVAHAHIDMNWLWGYEETAAVTVNTFRTMLRLMERYPQFTFSQSQASTYEIIAKFAPEMLEEIGRRIKEGRWELSSATWVENDENMPSVESLARHILYTGRFYKELFGEDTVLPQTDFQPDTFGHGASVPDVMNAGGVKRFYHCRGNDGSESAYIWKGAGKGELLTWCDPIWYGGGAVNAELLDRVPGVCEKYGITPYLLVYGVGDHGGGPTASDIESLTEMQKDPLLPTLIFSSYRAFFDELEAFRATLPVREGECNFVFSGCYTSQSEIKAFNHRGEARLNEAETLSAMACVWAKSESDSAIFERAWRKLLFSQFHDILPGSGVRQTREFASGCFQEAIAAAVCRSEAAMQAIEQTSGPKKTQDQPLGAGVGSGVSCGTGLSVPSAFGGKKRFFRLYNTAQSDFEGTVALNVWNWAYDCGRAFFTYASGERIESAVLQGGSGYWGHEYKTFLLFVRIPGTGCTTVVLDEEERSALPGIPFYANRVLSMPSDEIVLENDLLRVVFDRKTAKIVSFCDKKSGEELFEKGSGFFRASIEDARQGMTAWKEGATVREQDLNEVCDVYCSGPSSSGLRSSFSYELTYGSGTRLRVRVSLDKGETLLRCDVDAEFYERAGEEGVPRLDAVFPLRKKAESFRCGSSLGTVDRKALAHDVPALFAALPEKKRSRAPALFGVGKYGFRMDGERLSLTLLRASGDPDPLPEYGRHQMSFYVGCAISSPEALCRLYARILHPPVICPCALPGKTPERRFAKLDNAELLAVKRAENGKGIAFRLTNLSQTKQTFTLTFCKKLKKAYLCDLHETKQRELAPEGTSVSAEIRPKELLTLIVE